MELIISAFLLGVAGFDVLGVIVLVAALSARVPKKSILIFVITAFIATVLLGVGLSLFLSPLVDYIANMVNQFSDSIWVIINLFLIVLLFVWVLFRTVKLANKKSFDKRKHKSFFSKIMKYGMVFVGIVFALSSIFDPTFLALIALAGNNSDIISVVTAFAVWVLISQISLFIFAVAILINKHKNLNEWIKKIQKKYSQTISISLTIIIFIVCLLLLINLITFLNTGSWLIN